MSRANHRAASAEKGKQAETFSLLVPTASLQAAQLSSAAENLQSIGGNSLWMKRFVNSLSLDLDLDSDLLKLELALLDLLFSFSYKNKR